MRRFYVEKILGVGERIDIKGAEARHIREALRLRIGDSICLFDGSGKEFRVRIAGFGGESVSVDILDAGEGKTESPVEIVLGQGMPKSDKMDIIIQKGTELGVSTIVPLYTERVVPKSFNSNKLARWRNIAIEACKQSGRVKVPSVREPVNLEGFVADADPLSLRLMPWEEESASGLKDVLPDFLDVAKATLIVGPEGGFSADEAGLARRGGFTPVSLGKRILRTETVPIAIISIIQYLYGDLS